MTSQDATFCLQMLRSVYLMLTSTFKHNAYFFTFDLRPDMTFAVDGALNNNYLSLYPCQSLGPLCDE